MIVTIILRVYFINVIRLFYIIAEPKNVEETLV